MGRKQSSDETENVKPGGAPEKGRFAEERLAEDIVGCDESNPDVYGVFEKVEDFLDKDGNPMPSKLNPDLTIQVMRMKDMTTGAPFAVWFNGGLKGAISFNKVKMGMAIHVHYEGKIEHPTNSAQEINNYTIKGLKAL